MGPVGEPARTSPRAPDGVPVVSDDGGMAPGRPANGAEASSSRAAFPASDGAAVRPEQERERTDAPPAHFASAQDEQALWQEFRDHDTSLNRALNEALRIHGGPAWRIFRVSDFSSGFVVFSLCFFRVCTPPDPPSSLALPVGGRIWSVGPRRGTTPSTAWTPSSTGTGSSTTPSTPSLRP
jgi:hypothetical protein